MTVKKGENSEENAHTSKIKFHLEDETDDFHSEMSDEKAMDAEILRETRTIISPQIEEPSKEANAVAALLSNLNTDSEVSIIVTRLNDRQYKKQYRLPCEADEQKEVISWDGSPYPDSIYEYVRKRYGGGHYRFQLRYDGGFKQSWKEVLGDPVGELSDAEKLLKKDEAKISEQPRIIESSQVFANSERPDKLESIRETMSFMREMRQFERELAPEAAAVPPADPETKTPPSKYEIAFDFYKNAADEKTKSKILDKIFGSSGGDEIVGDEKGVVAQIVDYSVQNPDKALSFAQMLLGGLVSVAAPIINRFAPAAPTAPQPTINLRPPQQQPPAQTIAQPQPPPKNEPQPAPDAPNDAPVEQPAANLPELPFIRI